jgi:hypothetical protein
MQSVLTCADLAGAYCYLVASGRKGFICHSSIDSTVSDEIVISTIKNSYHHEDPTYKSITYIKSPSKRARKLPAGPRR